MIPFSFNPMGVGKKGGSGTATDPYQIWDAADLLDFASKLNTTTEFAGIYHKVMADIDLTGVAYAMSSSRYYAGNFNGNGKKISNFSNSVTTYAFGFFSRTRASARISNLYLDKVTLSSTADGLGGIVGVDGGGVIENCCITGTLTRTGGSYVGGIVGSANIGTVVRNCFADVIINCFQRGGAICGQYGKITNCITKGQVNGTGNANGGVNGLAYETAPNIPDKNVALNERVKGGIIGRIAYNATAETAVNYAIKTMLLNTAAVSSDVGNSKDGIDITDAQSKEQNFYITLGFDFSIWKMSDAGGYYQGIPVLNYMNF